MQVVPLFVFFSFGKIEFAARKDLRIGRHWQAFLYFFGREGRELGKEFEASFANGFAHWAVSHIREKYKWRGRAKLLALKKQRRPWSKQKQRGHGAVAPGRTLETQALTCGGV